MSSSTMMKGPTMLRASQARTTNEPATRPPSQTQAGTALTPAAIRSRSPAALAAREDSATKLDLGEPPGDLTCLRSIRRDPDVRRRLAHLLKHRVADRAPACGL